METRALIAYVLIAVMVIAVVALIAYLRHNTRDRKIERGRNRQYAATNRRRRSKPE